MRYTSFSRQLDEAESASQIKVIIQLNKVLSFFKFCVDLRNPFTTSQILLIHKAIRNVQWVLKERGLDPLPVELYEFFDTNL